MSRNESQITLCGNSTGGCDSYISAVFVAINIVSIIVNIMHILILSKIPALRKLNYFWILVNLTLVDIGASIAFAFGVSCPIYQLQVSAESMLGSIILLAAMDSTSLCRYFQLTLAGLDRFYAVCKPFDYTDSRILRNVGKVSLLSWILIGALCAANVALNSQKCFGEVGPFLGKLAANTNYMYIEIALVLAIIVPSVATAVLLGKVMRELKRMKQKRNMNEEDREVRSAARYVIGTCILFYSTVALTFVFVIINLSMEIKTDLNRIFQWVAVGIHAFYGIGNVVLYGLMNHAYVAKIKNIIGTRCSKVSPN